MSYTPLDRLANCQTYMEQEAEKIQGMISIKCQAAIKAQLLDWSKRFPRHKFRAWEGHGLLAFEVDPPVFGQKSPDYLDQERGAIGEMGREAAAFLKAWNDMEYKLTSSPVTAIITIDSITRDAKAPRQLAPAILKSQWDIPE